MEEKMKERGILVIFSGFSGAGKGTVIKGVTEKYDNYALSISATTRQPRQGEENGREYYFKTVDEFEQMIKEDKLIEYAKYVDNYYGTPREYVENKLSEGYDVVLEIELQGAMKVKEKMKDAVLIFLTPPSAEELKRRLTGRGTENEDVINLRLDRASTEAQYMDKYDYILVNDQLDKCIEDFHEIVQTEHKKVNRNMKFIDKIKKEVKVFSKGE